MSPEAEVG